VNKNFPKYFPEMPVLEFLLHQYEVHDHEGPIAFAKTWMLIDLLKVDREYTSHDEKLVKFLFFELMCWRSQHGQNLKMLWRRNAITSEQHTEACE
jgi:hypothetical protein